MIEVWKQMLEVLEYWDVHGGVHQPTEEAIQAGKKAIAELESQEPVAHWSDCAVHSEPAYPKGECDCGGYTHHSAQSKTSVHDAVNAPKT
jgi:hypothetical protein